MIRFSWEIIQEILTISGALPPLLGPPPIAMMTYYLQPDPGHRNAPRDRRTFRVLLLLRDWRDSSESRQREGRHQPTFAAEDTQHPPTAMSNLIRDETEEEPSGSSTQAAQERGIITCEKMFSPVQKELELVRTKIN